MAKSPKSKELSQKGKLDKLKALHIVGPTVKTFNKSAKSLWSDYIAAFPKGVAGNQTFLRASPDARKAAESVNMRVIGGAVVFPTGTGGTAKLRETKRGVFIDYGRKGAERGKLDTIILSKDLNHIRYGMELSRKHKNKKDGHGFLHSWGTLKTHAFSTSKNGTGEMVRGFMRDTARAEIDPLAALLDNRYKASTMDLDDEFDDDDAPLITREFVARLQETNGVAALIRVNY